jgi:hypothetical protein
VVVVLEVLPLLIAQPIMLGVLENNMLSSAGVLLLDGLLVEDQFGCSLLQQMYQMVGVDGLPVTLQDTAQMAQLTLVAVEEVRTKPMGALMSPVDPAVQA